MAFRVPTPNMSIMEKPAKYEDIKKVVKQASWGLLKGTLGLYWLVLCQLDTAGVTTEKGASVEEMSP